MRKTTKPGNVFEEVKTGNKLIFIRAERVHTYGNGLVGIEIQGRQLEEDERKLITNLFPNTADQVHTLLEKEAILTAMDDTDVNFEGTEHIVNDTRWALPPKMDSTKGF